MTGPGNPSDWDGFSAREAEQGGSDDWMRGLGAGAMRRPAARRRRRVAIAGSVAAGGLLLALGAYGLTRTPGGADVEAATATVAPTGAPATGTDATAPPALSAVVDSRPPAPSTPSLPEGSTTSKPPGVN